MIRKARPDDAKIAISLLAQAMDNFVYKLSGSDDFKSALEILCEFFMRKGNRLSYENCLIFEEKGEILGAILFYDGKRSEILDLPLRERLKNLNLKDEIFKECEDEFYLDSVAVSQKARGRGIAKMLINHALEKARENGKKLSLIVENDNFQAKRLYQNLGFVFIKEKIFYNHKYQHLEKS